MNKPFSKYRSKPLSWWLQAPLYASRHSRRMARDGQWVRAVLDLRALQRLLDAFESGKGDPRIPPRALNLNHRPVFLRRDYENQFIYNAKFREVPFLIERCGLKPDSAILDYGCGMGRLAFPISEYLNQSGSYLGVDVVKSVVEWLQRVYAKYPNLRFEHLPIEVSQYYIASWIDDAAKDLILNKGQTAPSDISLSVPDKSIDVQISTSVFTHMFREDIIPALRELGRVTHISGIGYNTWFIADALALEGVRQGKADRQLPLEKDGLFIQKPDDPLACTAYTPEAMADIYQSAGHEIISIHHGSWSGSGRDNRVLYQDIVVSRPQ